MYYTDMSGPDLYGYLTSNDTTNKVKVLNYTHLTGYNATKGIQKVMAYGYANNETQGNIPVIYKIRDNIASEFHDIYDTLTSSGARTWGMVGYFCTTCGEATLIGTDKADCTLTAECTGKLAKNHALYKNIENKTYGFLSSPIPYEWTVHVASELGSEFTIENGAVKFAGVNKYASVDAMKSATNDFTSFTGETGNGMWDVVEGELVWLGA
jgi:hypothetical protein